MKGWRFNKGGKNNMEGERVSTGGGKKMIGKGAMFVEFGTHDQD